MYLTKEHICKRRKTYFSNHQFLYYQECKASIQKCCTDPSSSSDSAKPHPQAPIASHLIKSSCLSSASLDKSNILTHPSARRSAQKLGSFLPLSADVYLTSMLTIQLLTIPSHNTLSQYSQYPQYSHNTLPQYPQYSQYSHNTPTILTIHSHNTHNTLTIPSQYPHSCPSVSLLLHPFLTPSPFLLKGDPIVKSRLWDMCTRGEGGVTPAWQGGKRW